MAERGRPTSYTPEIGRAICERVARGETIKQITRDEDMPPDSTVRGWILDNREGFSELYARAREMQFEVMSEDILEIADDGSNDWMDRHREYKGVDKVENAEAIARSRLRVDTRKWLLSKLAPKKYGDKVDHHVDGGVTVNIVRFSDADSNPAK